MLMTAMMKGSYDDDDEPLGSKPRIRNRDMEDVDDEHDDDDEGFL